MATLIQEPARPEGRSGAPEPLAFRTRHDVSLTAQALELRAEDLTKLAKKNQDEGYRAEARAILGDVGAIKEVILPQLADQRELPIATPEDVESAVANALRPGVHALVRSTRAAPTNVGDESVAAFDRDRADGYVARLAERVARYAAEVAERAYTAGLAARESTPEAIAVKSIDLLEYGG